MSVISVGRRRYAANLHWRERGGRRATARAARRLQRHWFVRDGGHTGFVALDIGGSPDGLPALPLALQALIGGESWMALVEGDADSGGLRYALVKAPGGAAVLPHGEEVFDDRAAALEAFGRTQAPGWTGYATPELVSRREGPDADIAVLDPDALGEAASRAGPAIIVARPMPGRCVDWRRVAVGVGFAVLVEIGIVAMVAAGFAWEERDALLEWISGSADEPKPLIAPFKLLDRTSEPPSGEPFPADR